MFLRNLNPKSKSKSINRIIWNERERIRGEYGLSKHDYVLSQLVRQDWLWCLSVGVWKIKSDPSSTLFCIKITGETTDACI